MTMQNIFHKLELAFWDRAIPLMTESDMIRNFIRDIYEIHAQPSKGLWIPITMILSASMGLGIGYIIGVVRLITW